MTGGNMERRPGITTHRGGQGGGLLKAQAVS